MKDKDIINLLRKLENLWYISYLGCIIVFLTWKLNLYLCKIIQNLIK